MAVCHVCGGAGLCPLCDGSGRDEVHVTRSFGWVLGRLMTDRHVTILDLSGRMDYDRTMVDRVLTGRRNPGPRFLARACDALGLDAHEGEMLFLAAGHASERTQVRARQYLANGGDPVAASEADLHAETVVVA
jgi:transcriptional regulator with XRE-family HTH domain